MICKLKDISIDNRGYYGIGASAVNYDKDKYTYLRITDINDDGSLNEEGLMSIDDENASKYLLEKNDIVFARTGASTGRNYFYDGEIKNLVYAGFLIKFSLDEKKVNPKFIKYYCLSKKYKDWIRTSLTGSTRPNINEKQLSEMPIILPNMNCQNKFVEIMDSLTNKIKLNNEINNNLYDICNCIYHSIQEKYKEEIIEKSISEIAKKVVTGKTPSTKNNNYWNGDIPFITIPDMHNQVFTINTERTITREGAKSLIPKNSISVSCIATVGLVSINNKDSQTNQQINSIVIQNDYDLYYLFEFLSEQEQYMKSIAGGSTTYNINKNTFENIVVPYLPSERLIEFNEIVKPMFKKIKLNQIENNKLEQLRDTLLPKLMNGEIDLEKIERWII
jgi:type I restriction enzyme S subunit